MHSSGFQRQTIWRVAALALHLACGTPVWADSPFAAWQAAAEAALVANDPAETARLAALIIAQSPDHYPAHFLQALALSDLEEFDAAIAAGREAFRLAPDAEARLRAARLIASAHFRQRQFTRAAFWLRRAANAATTPEDRAELARDYARIRDANPLSLQLAAYVAPSDNINGGSDEGILTFEGIPIIFTLPEDQQALSGIGIGGNLALDYRLSRSLAQKTELYFSAHGTTYRLSTAARALLDSSPNPDVRAVTGADFATLQVESGISHHRYGLLPFGSTRLSLGLGRYGQGDTWLLDYTDLALQQGFVSKFGLFELTLSQREQQARQTGLADETRKEVEFSFNRILRNADEITVFLARQDSDIGPETSYDETRLGLSYQRRAPVLGVRLAGGAMLGVRDFPEYLTTLDGREDHIAELWLDGVFASVSYFGFAPQVALLAKRQSSSAEEETSSQLQLQFGIGSRF